MKSKERTGRAMSQRELNASYHAWEKEFQERTIHAIDERYKQMTTSLEARIKLLEEGVKKANEDMEVSREYVGYIQEPPSTTDCGVQTHILPPPSTVDCAVQTRVQTPPRTADCGTQTRSQPRPSTATCAVQTGIKGVRQISDLESKVQTIKTVEVCPYKSHCLCRLLRQ
ncbi:hypothetical protein BJV82DRAFT_274559 [Fennellomyces sp. T-0311]|nr:hypothetical protein BJV82DRAFT_274559 [Fennellomyces sp. T-0311]